MAQFCVPGLLSNFPISLLLLLILPLLIVKLASKLINPRSQLLNLPPGPPTLPMLGNLHQLGSLPHRSLRRLAKAYGPLMHLRLGQLPTVVVSSSRMAREVLKAQDHLFCTRPPLSALRKIYYGGLDIAFAPYNEHWRQARRICTTELLSQRRVQLFLPIRAEEIDILVNTVRRHSSNSELVDLSEMFLCLLNNITCREVFGKRFAEDSECGRSRFHELITEWTSLMGHFNVGEFFPSMEWINQLTGLSARFEKNFSGIDNFLDEVIEAHGEEGVELEHDYITSVLLRLKDDPTVEIPLTRDHIKAILMDMFIAGTDTGALALEWGMAELMRNPAVRKKAQDEVRAAVGAKQKVEESDLQQLPYLKLVVKEILRLHPPGPFLLPRASRRDCTIDGYDIPAGTRVTINVWAIGRDPESWDDAEKFMPERFEDGLVDYKGHHFQLLPFGAGRRGCPGIHLGTAIVELALANLLHAFDWYVPDGLKEEEIDMQESFGIVVRKKSPLLLVAVPRIDKQAEA